MAQLEAGGSAPGCTASEARAQFDSLRAGRPVSNHLICGAGATFWRQWMRHSQKADSIAAALEDSLFVQQGLADQNYPESTLEQNLTAWRRIAQAGNASVQTYEDVTPPS